MPTVEKTHGGQVYLTAIDTRVSIGDRIGVSEGFAEHLVESRGDFRIADDSAEPTAEMDSTDEDDGDGEGFDVDAWLDEPYQGRADRVLEGDVDDHLDAIDEAESSDTVRDAIGERRAELEG